MTLYSRETKAIVVKAVDNFPVWERVQIAFRESERRRAEKFERKMVSRSMSTTSDLAANRTRLAEIKSRADAVKGESVPRAKPQKMKYNEQLRRFEFVEIA